MKYVPSLELKQADHLLNRAYRAFVYADFHPWDGIEVELWNAVAGASMNAKARLMWRILPMLGQSDLPTTRRLGENIHEFLVTRAQHMQSIA